MEQDVLVPHPIWGGMPAFFLHFGHNWWANGRVMIHLGRITDAELNAPKLFDDGSAFQVLLHMLDAEWTSRRAIQEGLKSPYIWDVEKFPDIESVGYFWIEEHKRMDAYLHSLNDDDLNRNVVYGATANNEPLFGKLIDILINFLYHSKGHRNELAAYLTQCGQSPGSLEFVDYVEAVSPPSPQS
jgi:uncharacterized damage-inducible protein DinB